ncbi:glycosyl transferase [Candidatus Micrarchaeota archaeon CG10_big_fil_rev_8_21_14_0_10_59_7]|nr:MAG: glycosyl transferase [Candidatus Micrarchaeota archaeon CG10_big_fil_rev_8_21_14_0_10_59_7]
MRVSVVIPTYNEGKRIAACIKSLKAQTLKPYEIIVADDESPDKTAAIAKKMGARVILVSKRRISAGRRAGAKAARGEIIACTDGDTVLDKNWLRELCAPFSDSRVVSAHGAVFLTDGNSIDAALCRFFLNPYFAATNALGLPSGAGSSMAVRLSALKKIGGFDETLVTGEDVDVQRRVRRFGRTVFIGDAVAYVSARRIRRWGYLRFFLFHLGNWLRILFGNPARAYERVR